MIVKLNDFFLRVYQNNKTLATNILGTFILKGIAISLGLVSIRVYLGYFENKSVLGLWFTILALLNWILNFDIGIGNGLRNRLASSYAISNKRESRELISTAYIILGIFSVFMFILGYLIIGMTNWNTLLNVESNYVSNRTLIITIRILFSGISLQFWLKTITSILLSVQRNILANIPGLLTSIMMVLFLLTFRFNSPVNALYAVSIANVISINVPLILVTTLTFRKLLKGYSPQFSLYNKMLSSKILKMGGVFFFIQLALLFINSTNEWLISSLFDTSAVVDYQLYYRFFSIALLVFTLFTQPFWSAITHAYEQKKINWISKSYFFLNIIAFIGSLLCFAIIPFMQPIFDFWLGNKVIIVNARTALIFAISISLQLFLFASTCVANGMGKLKTQFYLTIIAAFVKIPLSFYLSNYFNFWEIIVISNLVVLVPLIVIQPISVYFLLFQYRS